MPLNGPIPASRWNRTTRFNYIGNSGLVKHLEEQSVKILISGLKLNNKPSRLVQWNSEPAAGCSCLESIALQQILPGCKEDNVISSVQIPLRSISKRFCWWHVSRHMDPRGHRSPQGEQILIIGKPSQEGFNSSSVKRKKYIHTYKKELLYVFLEIGLC